MALPLFLFGTLCHAPLLSAVAGGADRLLLPARAPGWRAVVARGALHPLAGLTAGGDAVVDGLLFHPDPDQRARIMAWAEGLGLCARPVAVVPGAGAAIGEQVQALCLLPADAAQGTQDWSLALWVQSHAALAVDAAPELLALAAALPPEGLRRRLPTLAMRVASRLRARAAPAPATLRRQPAPGDLRTDALARPYTAFFAVEEADLRFRRFDGSLSPQVRRAGFVMADAVTVLPYDPVRDRVLVVEQFRYGPVVRGDLNPWSLEPVAGRIDPGELPEQTVRRETREEARLELGALHLVGRYYPSPGAVSEYIWSYIGIAALDAGAAGVGGLTAEAEDIRAHVIGFDRLMALVGSGEAENGPLLLSALWLAANRDRLRQA